MQLDILIEVFHILTAEANIMSLANLIGDNSSRIYAISLSIPFDECAASSIKTAANWSRTAIKQHMVKEKEREKKEE